MASPQSAPCSPVTPAGGGAPARSTTSVDVGAVLVGIENRFDELVDLTFGELAPYVDDLRGIYDALGAVLEAQRTGGPVSGSALLALADAVGVTTTPGSPS